MAAEPGAVARWHLLVVDDEVYNVDLVRRTFWRAAVVHAAGDRAEAEVVLATEAIDVALLDYRLDDGARGGGSGLELAQVVRARRPDAAIVMVTGFAEDPALAAARTAGVIDELVGKPWAPVELRRRVDELRARRAARG